MENTIKFLRCQNGKCQKKMRPPFMICEKGHQVCTNCSCHQMENEDGCTGKIINAYAFDELLQNVTDFCQYDCGFCNTVKELEIHEKTCQQKEKHIKCIIPNCQWRRSQDLIIQHFVDVHPLQIIELTATNTSFLLSKDCPILLVTQFPKESVINVLYSSKLSMKDDHRGISVDYLSNIGRNDEAVKIFDEFIVSPSNNTNIMIVAKITKVSEEATDITILNDDVYKVKLINPVKSLLPEAVASMFECVVCVEVMQAPIKLCETGHSFCGKCALKLQFCPMCNKNIMESRNYSLEQVIEKIHIRCPNEGCQVSGLRPDIQEHAKKCEFQVVKCFAMCQNDCVYRCKWSGQLKDFLKHWEDDHKSELKKNGSTFTSCWWYTYLYPISDQFFLFTYIYDQDNYYFSVHHLTKSKETDFKFDVGFTHPVNGNKAEFAGNCVASNWSDVGNHDYLRNCGNVFMIPLDWMNKCIREKRAQYVKMTLTIFKDND